MQAIPLFINAFTCQPQLFSIYNDLRKPTLRRLDSATSIAFVVCGVLYIVMGVSGYVTYGSSVTSDLLGTYPLNSEVTVARLGIAFVLAVSYPLLMHPTRDAVYQNIVYFGNVDPLSKFGVIIYYVTCTVLVAITFIVAIIKVKIDVILTLSGAVSTANLMFTLPAVFYWFLFKHEGYSKHRLACIPIFFLGIFICIVNIVLWIVIE